MGMNRVDLFVHWKECKYLKVNIMYIIPEFNSLTNDDIAFVTESAATSKSFLKLRLPHVIEPLTPEFKLDVLTGVPSQKHKLINLRSF